MQTPSAAALAQIRKDVLNSWSRAVRSRIKSASSLSQPLLIDTVPAFIDHLVEALEETHPRRLATDSSNISKEHGGERARLSRYSPEHLLEEYILLRQTILRKLARAVELTGRDRRIIQKSFDRAICNAMEAFFLVHNSIREKFIAGLSHDLRSPLSSIRMAADLVLEHAQDKPEIKSLTERIVHNCRRADRLIQDILDSSLLHFGEALPLKVAECDVLALIKELINDMAEEDRARIRIDGEGRRVHWDCDAVIRAVENLIANAFKYGRAETPVSITIRTEQGRILISVHNEGARIPEEDQKVMFEAFRRAQAAKESGKKGWGIGLALVRAVAEGHGGSVIVDSSEELGTTFTIDIPADARPMERNPPPTT